MSWSYLHWLVAISAAFVLLERLLPWRRGQALLRPGWARDLGFLAINGHFFSLLTAGLNGWLALQATFLLQRAGLRFNSPRMHLWHHDASDEGGVAKSFGIVLSLWDFLFRTAYWPRDRSPRALGYPGMEEMPQGLLGELAWPVRWSSRPPS